MTEIEKLYESVGIKQKYSGWLDMGDLDTQMEYVQCNTKEEWDECCNMSRSDFSSDNKEWYEPKMEYPPFTAEKQLELIKWLAYKTHITIGKGLPWGQYDDNWWTITSKKGYSGMNTYKLEEALANFVNSLWQDLTKTEQEEIKRILEQ